MSPSLIDVTIGFQSQHFITNEAAGAVTLKVEVLGVVLDIPVQVNLTIRDGTATSTAPEDYVKPMLPITLTFPGDDSSLIQEAVINITDDNITENDEQFTCILSSIDPSIILDPDTASVIIQDNDGEPDIF